MIIDAHDLILGRVATVAAKSAMKGEEVHIVNCDTAIISGDKKRIFADFQRKRAMGIPSKGPFIKRSSHMIMKRAIRGMLPYKQPKGRDAFKRIKCYKKIPETLNNSEFIKLEKANLSKLPKIKYVTLFDVCKIMGARSENN
jgi:large subunit ribosomal protein L13